METIGQYLLSQKRTYVVKENIKTGHIRALIDSERITTPDEVIKRVSERLNIPIFELKGKSRKREIVDANMMLSFLLRSYLKLSFKSIAKILNRDHSTIIYRVNEHEKLVISDRGYRQKFEKCKY
tara:strand:- start:1884 stop:2258 length:375 start_codon:yes stop_codon:yes gene_type:complete